MGVTLNSCLRIALEKPPELDADHLIDLVVGMLVLGLSPSSPRRAAHQVSTRSVPASSLGRTRCSTTID
jgi:hypothetical protein